MANSSAGPGGGFELAAAITATIERLEQEESTVLTTEQVAEMADGLRFMRTSSKNMSGVFVDGNDRTQLVRLFGQVSENFDLYGSIKFNQPHELSITKILNGKWKLSIKVPGDEPLSTENTAKLLNQALFFSALQSRHEGMLPDPNPDAVVWGFVKNQLETEFVLTGCIQPMFYKYKSSDEETFHSIETAIRNAQSGDTINNNYSLRNVECLETFPDPDGKFVRVAKDMKKQLILNVDAEVYDEEGHRLHPFQYSEFFGRDVWCIMDVSIKFIDMTDAKTPSRTYQLQVHRVQAINQGRLRRKSTMANRVAGVKRGAPESLDCNVRKPLPPVSRPLKLRVFEGTNGERSGIVTMSEPRGLNKEPSPSSSLSSKVLPSEGESSVESIRSSNEGSFVFPEQMLTLNEQAPELEPEEDSEMVEDEEI